MMTPIPKPESSKNNKILVLSIVGAAVGLLLMGSVAIALLVFFMSSRSEAVAVTPKIDIPPYQDVELEKFCQKYQNWAVLSNFEIEEKTDHKDQPYYVAHVDARWASPNQRPRNVDWILEAYQDRKLVQRFRFRLGNRTSMSERLKDQDNPEAYAWVSYFQHSTMSSKVMVSGFIERDGPSSPATPIAYLWDVDTSNQVTLSDAKLELSGTAPRPTSEKLQFDFSVKDNAVLENVNKESWMEQAYQLRIEDCFGNIFHEKTSVTALLDRQGQMQVPTNARTQWAFKYLHHRPLRVSIEKIPPFRNRNIQSPGKLETTELISNILEVK